MQKDQDHDMKPDDEIDSTFFGYANRMYLHLNQDQKDVLQEINKIVTEAINNVHAGLSVITRSLVFVPPVPPLQQATPPPPMQQMGTGHQGGVPPMQQMVNAPQPPPMQPMGNQQQPYDFTYTPL